MVRIDDSILEGLTSLLFFLEVRVMYLVRKRFISYYIKLIEFFISVLIITLLS